MTHYKVTGMSCAACSARVEKAVSHLSGTEACSVNLLTGDMTVEGAVKPEKVISAVKKAGYGARVRALSSFSGLCASLTDGAFGGYNAMDAFAVSAALTEQDVQSFLADALAPERFAMSVITPVGKEALANA